MGAGVAWTGGLLALSLVLVGCQSDPHTEWRERPVEDRQAPPPGHAVFEAVLEQVDSELDGRVLPPSPDVTRSYARILRRAAVFTEVFGAEASGRRQAAQLRLRSELSADEKAAGNVGRSVMIALSLTLLRPALPFQLDVDGEMVLEVLLPGEGKVRSYRARSAASRFYYRSGDYRGALEVVMREVTTENLRGIVAQLRADPALTAAPAFERPR